MLKRNYGYVTSNIGSTDGFTTLEFIDPSSINGIKATIKPTKFEITGCDNNTAQGYTLAYLNGEFFNTDLQTPNGYANDVYAWIGVWRNSKSTDPEDTARVKVRVAQCKDANCAQTSTLFWYDLGTLKEGQSATLSLQWDKANHKFIFMRGTQRVEFAYDASEYPDSSPPAMCRRQLGAEGIIPNCTATSRPTGLMNALFDNVYVK